MNVFYIQGAQEGLTTLPEEESKHCVKVLRMTEGDRFCVTDGAGSLYDAELVEALPKRATARLSNRRPGYDHWGFQLEIAIAPTKLNERTEWFLEKATEIGIDRVRLFTSYHSERRAANVERFQKVMVAAMKQSIKSRLPKVDDLMPFDKLVKQPFEGQKFIAWIDDDVKECLCDLYHKGENALVLIGPEGDFSPEEVALAKENGFVPCSLGDARLRTETAALVACHTVQLINQMKGKD
ncbi:MAG: 16S rRNA (uracil(1498)-N(3))-methyltransferase [Bacteroidales bacterium]|nr:16S rRNA (uracil(1498)-N(3))-methyltransferase [Bacteroidales bacterium]